MMISILDVFKVLALVWTLKRVTHQADSSRTPLNSLNENHNKAGCCSSKHLISAATQIAARPTLAPPNPTQALSFSVKKCISATRWHHSTTDLQPRSSTPFLFLFLTKKSSTKLIMAASLLPDSTVKEIMKDLGVVCSVLIETPRDQAGHEGHPPFPVTKLVNWLHPTTSCKAFPTSKIFGMIYKEKVQPFWHSKEELKMYKEILETKKAIVAGEKLVLNTMERTLEVQADLFHVMAELEAVQQAEDFDQNQPGAREITYQSQSTRTRTGKKWKPSRSSLHNRCSLAYGQAIKGQILEEFVNFDMLVEIEKDQHWFVKRIQQNQGFFKDSNGVTRRIIWDCNHSLVKMCTVLAGYYIKSWDEPAITYGSVPAAEEEEQAYNSTESSSNCSLWRLAKEDDFTPPDLEQMQRCSGARCSTCQRNIIISMFSGDLSEDDAPASNVSSWDHEKDYENAGMAQPTAVLKLYLGESFEAVGRSPLNPMPTGWDASQSDDHNGASTSRKLLRSASAVPLHRSYNKGQPVGVVTGEPLIFSKLTKRLERHEDFKAIKYDVKNLINDWWYASFSSGHFGMFEDTWILNTLLECALALVQNTTTLRYEDLFFQLIRVRNQYVASAEGGEVDEQSLRSFVRNDLFQTITFFMDDLKDRRMKSEVDAATSKAAGLCEYCPDDQFYPHVCHGGSLRAVTITNVQVAQNTAETDDQSEANDIADITDITEDFEAAQATSSNDEADNEASDTTSDYDCYHPSRCASEAGTPGRFNEYRGTPERDFTLSANPAPLNALTSPNNRRLGGRGQPGSPPVRIRSLREALDEMNTTSEVMAVAESIDERRERVQREVNDFFETFNNNARFEIDPPPPPRTPYALHAYLWEGSESLDDQLRRQLPTNNPEVLSITQELEAMDTTDQDDQPDLPDIPIEYHPMAIVHDESLAQSDARAGLTSPTLEAVLRDLEVLEDDDDDTMSHCSSHDSNETRDWRTAYSDEFSSDDEAEEPALPAPTENPAATPWCSTPKRNNPDVEDA